MGQLESYYEAFKSALLNKVISVRDNLSGSLEPLPISEVLMSKQIQEEIARFRPYSDYCLVNGPAEKNRLYRELAPPSDMFAFKNPPGVVASLAGARPLEIYSLYQSVANRFLTCEMCSETYKELLIYKREFNKHLDIDVEVKNDNILSYLKSIDEFVSVYDLDFHDTLSKERIDDINSCMLYNFYSNWGNTGYYDQQGNPTFQTTPNKITTKYKPFVLNVWSSIDRRANRGEDHYSDLRCYMLSKFGYNPESSFHILRHKSYKYCDSYPMRVETFTLTPKEYTREAA